MTHKVLRLPLSFILGFLVITGFHSVYAQEATYPPLGKYSLIWQPADHEVAGCQTRPNTETQAPPTCGEVVPPATGDCTTCRRSPAADPSASTVCGSTESEPPEQLRAFLQELQAHDQVRIY